MHFADVLEFATGATVAKAEADLVELVASDGPPPAGVTPPEEIGGSQIASPGNGNTFSLTLESGRVYAVLCFVSDKAGGPPHAIAHKMYKVFMAPCGVVWSRAVGASGHTLPWERSSAVFAPTLHRLRAAGATGSATDF